MASAVGTLGALLLLSLGTRATTLRRRSGADPAVNDVAPVAAGREASGGALQMFRQADPDPDPLTVYCFMVVMPNTQEVELLRIHLRRKMLSGCADWVVMSNVSKAEDLMGPVTEDLPDGELLTARHYQQTITGPMERVRRGQQLLNSDLMMQAWRALWRSRNYLRFRFVARIDPDLVLFPHRLSAVLESFRYISSVLLFDGGKQCSLERGGLAVLSRGLMDRIGPKLMNMTDIDQPEEDQLLINATKQTDNGFVWFSPNMLQGQVGQCRKTAWRAAYHRFGHSQQMENCLQQLHEATQVVPKDKKEFFENCTLNPLNQHSLPVQTTPM